MPGTIIERGTGRKYVLVKRYNPAGKFMERATLRRYTLTKHYV